MMPTPESIQAGLTSLANEWRLLAIGWHVFVGVLLLAVCVGWRPSNRHAGYLLTAPLLSVGGLALASGNPFNATVFLALSLLLLAAARRFSNVSVRLSSPFLVPGALLVLFGWSYPHFVKVEHWQEYLYAAPLGIVPCPTLSALIGLTLVFGLFRATVWASALVAAGVVYGVIGVFRLDVPLDYGLLAGAAVLAGATGHSSIMWRSVRARGDERARELPGDDLIPEAFGVLTHAITIRRSREDVWPWLAQMGAGSRAGWYSYDVLDNGWRLSATRIVPELQRLTVGMIFPAMPGATDVFTLLAFEPGRFLILGWVPPGGSPLVTWAFVLDEAEPGATRLIVRARGGRGYHFHGLPPWVTDRLMPLGHFVMQRRQLLGLARRAERSLPGDRTSGMVRAA